MSRQARLDEPGTLQYVIAGRIETRGIEGCKITAAEPSRQVGFRLRRFKMIRRGKSNSIQSVAYFTILGVI